MRILSVVLMITDRQTEATRAALAGKVGADVIIDYNGNPVLSAYAPIEMGNTTWAVLAEVDVAEAFCPKIEGKEKDFFTQYNSLSALLNHNM